MSPLILSAVAGESPISMDMPPALLKNCCAAGLCTACPQCRPCHPCHWALLGSYLVFLNLRPKNVELLQAQLTAPVGLPSVKESSRIWVHAGSVPWCVLSTGSLVTTARTRALAQLSHWPNFHVRARGRARYRRWLPVTLLADRSGGAVGAPDPAKQLLRDAIQRAPGGFSWLRPWGSIVRHISKRPFVRGATQWRSEPAR